MRQEEKHPYLYFLHKHPRIGILHRFVSFINIYRVFFCCSNIQSDTYLCSYLYLYLSLYLSYWFSLRNPSDSVRPSKLNDQTDLNWSSKTHFLKKLLHLPINQETFWKHFVPFNNWNWFPNFFPQRLHQTSFKLNIQIWASSLNICILVLWLFKKKCKCHFQIGGKIISTDQIQRSHLKFPGCCI